MVYGEILVEPWRLVKYVEVRRGLEVSVSAWVWAGVPIGVVGSFGVGGQAPSRAGKASGPSKPGRARTTVHSLRVATPAKALRTRRPLLSPTPFDTAPLATGRTNLMLILHDRITFSNTPRRNHPATRVQPEKIPQSPNTSWCPFSILLFSTTRDLIVIRIIRCIYHFVCLFKTCRIKYAYIPRSRILFVLPLSRIGTGTKCNQSAVSIPNQLPR